MSNLDQPKQRRGFAVLSPERRAEIARLGGSSVQAEKRSFARNPSLAAQAGRAGGQKSRVWPQGSGENS